VLARALKQQPRDMVGGAAAHARRELELRASPPLPGLTVADDDAIRGACRWIADNARVATGAVLVEGRTSQLRRVEVGERPDEVASDVLARPPARIGAAALRSLRARGWVVLRREATGTRGEPDAYAALEAGLASRARTALAELGLAR
ncbi:MAG TPA: hypothetical protein VHC67_10040, partial [Gaiellaceae bacterium]|nr:hypothetical protein [Gaiellaceae bacterium]